MSKPEKTTCGPLRRRPAHRFFGLAARTSRVQVTRRAPTLRPHASRCSSFNSAVLQLFEDSDQPKLLMQLYNISCVVQAAISGIAIVAYKWQKRIQVAEARRNVCAQKARSSAG